MDIKPVDLRDLEDELFRTFLLNNFDRRYVVDGGRLLEAILASGGQILKSEGPDRDHVNYDVSVFEAGTDRAFWENPRFLMYCYVTHMPGPFYGRALLVEGCSSAEEFVRFFHANVRRAIFDVDALVLGLTTRQLLIVTHYGVVALVQGPPHA